MNKDKEYIVDAKIDTTLTEEQQKNLRKKSKPVGEVPAYNRQNVFVDRRDPLAQKKVKPERRKNKKERRDLEPD
jgi:hypothetical protein